MYGLAWMCKRENHEDLGLKGGILADDMGYGDLSFMGAEDMQTPNIDAIAEQGLTFTNFYAILPYVRQVELRC